MAHRVVFHQFTHLLTLIDFLGSEDVPQTFKAKFALIDKSSEQDDWFKTG